MTVSDSQLETVVKLADEYLARLRRGERPSVTEYASRYPHLAQGIRDVFPMMGVMEDVASDARPRAETACDPASRAAALPAQPLARASRPRIFSTDWGGLTDGQVFFVITTDDPSKIKLAETRDKAVAGDAIDLESGASVNQKQFDVAAVDSASDTIDDNVYSYIHDAGQISAPSIALTAVNDTGLQAFGAVASVDHSHLVHDDDLTVSSANSAAIRAITASGSLAAGSSHQIALSGSVSINEITSSANVWLADAQVTANNAAARAFR